MDIQDMRILRAWRLCRICPPSVAELGLTPGTISKRIQAFEDELSARLFDRTTRSIRITEEGATFLVHVERILAEIEAACASVDDRVNKPKGTLKIAAPAFLGRRYVAPALCQFMRAYPANRGAGRPAGSPREPAGRRLRHRNPHGHACPTPR